MYSNQSEEYAIDKDKQFSNEEKDTTGKKKRNMQDNRIARYGTKTQRKKNNDTLHAGKTKQNISLAELRKF